MGGFWGSAEVVKKRPACQSHSETYASQKTGYSQAGLSKSLQLLESELGCKLFKRSREGLSLTKEGVEVKAVSKSIIDLASGLEQKLKSLSSVQSPKTLKIGMYDSIAIYFGVELSEYLRQVYPSVSLELTADSSSNLQSKIAQGSIDIAIGVNFHLNIGNKTRFFLLFEDNYSTYITSKNLYSDVENSIILHTNATDESGIATVELFKNELKGKRIHQVANFETLKQLVAAGLGVGILPTLVAKPLLQTGQLIPVES